MDPVTLALLGSVAAPVVGGLLGQSQAQGSLDAANAARNAALQQYANIQAPTIAEQQLQLGTLSSAGNLTPAQIQAAQQQSSALNNISTDPRIANAQMQALQQMGQLGTTGMTAADQAGYTLAANASGQANAAQQAQLMQQMQARGEGGSGAELMARLQASQGNANSLSNAQLQQAQMQQAARMQALSQYGSLGSNLQQAAFNQQAAQGSAQNAINQFNTSTMNQAQMANVAAQNQAQQYNLTNQQNIANTNVGIQNQQQQYNKGLYQQQFQNQMSKAAGEAGQYNGIAGANQQQAANTAGSYATIGQGVGTALGGFANSQAKSSAQPATYNFFSNPSSPSNTASE